MTVARCRRPCRPTDPDGRTIWSATRSLHALRIGYVLYRYLELARNVSTEQVFTARDSRALSYRPGNSLAINTQTKHTASTTPHDDTGSSEPKQKERDKAIWTSRVVVEPRAVSQSNVDSMVDKPSSLDDIRARSGVARSVLCERVGEALRGAKSPCRAGDLFA